MKSRHQVIAVLFAALSISSVMADNTNPAGQDLNSAGGDIKAAAVDIAHAAEFVGDKTVLVVETVGVDSYRYFFLPAGKDIGQGARIVATDVRVATVDTAKITIRTAEGTYYFVGDVSEDVYHDAIVPGLHFVVDGADDVGHFVVVGAEDVGHGVVVGAQAVGHGVVVGAKAVGHGFAVFGRAVGHFFGAGDSNGTVVVDPSGNPVVTQPAPVAVQPITNSVLDTGNGSEVVNSVEINSPSN